MYFKVPVVFERDVAHEERVFVNTKQEDAQWRQVDAVEHRSNVKVAGSRKS